MRMKLPTLTGVGLVLIMAAGAIPLRGQESPEVSLGVDLVSRYIWRGINVGDAPSVQPSLSLGVKGFEMGAWGAYSLSNEITGGDEIDLWLGYAFEFSEGGEFGLVLTDYYFPNAGEPFSNYNNYDDEDGPGAHILELGGSFTFPSFPLTLAGYYNFYNDEGNNIYLQADYAFLVGETSMNLFAGATPGSEDNPDLYGTEDFAFINLGVTAVKELSITNQFSLPVFGSLIVNPEVDVAYFVVGVSF